MSHYPILYHGTDARLIKMPHNTLCTYIKDCNMVIDCLWPVFKPYWESEDVSTVINGQVRVINQFKIEKYKDVLNRHSEGLYIFLSNRMITLEAREKGNELYQYGALYLTTDRYKAKRYAMNAFGGGEIGTTSYCLIQAAEALGWDVWKNNSKLANAIKNIKSFAETKPEPVIIPVTDIDFEHLCSQDGSKIYCIDEDTMPQDLRYTKEYRISLDNAEWLF